LKDYNLKHLFPPSQ